MHAAGTGRRKRITLQGAHTIVNLEAVPRVAASQGPAAAPGLGRGQGTPRRRHPGALAGHGPDMPLPRLLRALRVRAQTGPNRAAEESALCSDPICTEGGKPR